MEDWPWLMRFIAEQSLWAFLTRLVPSPIRNWLAQRFRVKKDELLYEGMLWKDLRGKVEGMAQETKRLMTLDGPYCPTHHVYLAFRNARNTTSQRGVMIAPEAPAEECYIV